MHRQFLQIAGPWSLLGVDGSMAIVRGEPFAADGIEVAVNDLSPRSTQSISRATTSPLINALTNATVAAVIATVEDDTEVPVPRDELPGANQSGSI